MDSMSALDASFVYLENETQHLHIGSATVFEGPAPDAKEIRDHVASRLDLVPRYRQKLRFVPFALGRPVWVDDPDFDLDYHVRRTALASPGGRAELHDLMGRIVSQPLDLDRPLWELWVAEGLADDRWALLAKIHHCMVDGVAANDLFASLLDVSPDAPRRERRPWSPASAPPPWRLATDALLETMREPGEALARVGTSISSPARTLKRLADFADGLSTFGGFGQTEVESSLNGPLGAHRRWRTIDMSLDDVRKIRAAHGGTVNDVVLAAVTRGFRDLLIARGEPVEGRCVRSLVPVSVRTEAEHGHFDNRIAAMFVDLPVGIEDPVERLGTLRADMEERKAHHQTAPSIVLNALTDHTPPPIFALTLKTLFRLEQHAVQTVTTNVPGPQQTLYLAGRAMHAAYPYVPLFGSVRIGVAVYSYAGQLGFGVSGDYETVRDIDVLASGIGDGFDALLRTC